MQTLTPSNFLSVGDKFYPEFAVNDKELPSGPTLLYTVIYNHAGKHDHCWPSQSRLASLCKCSQRSIKAYLRTLIHLEYIQVEKRGLQNVYRLLLSPRIQRLIDNVSGFIGENSAPNKGQNTLSVGANIAPRNKKEEIRKTPIPSSAISHSLHHSSVGVSSFSPKKEAKALSPTITTDFERLFSAWPVKQDKLACSKAFAQLAKQHRAPALEVILSAIDRLKSHDRRWKAGYVPNLKFWLLGERWNDEPIADGALHQSSQPSQLPANPTHASHISPRAEGARPQSHIVRPMKNASENLSRTKNDDVINQTVTALQRLWPSLQRGHFFASIGVAQCRGLSPALLVQRATEYIGTLNGNDPMPLRDWVRNYANA